MPRAATSCAGSDSYSRTSHLPRISFARAEYKVSLLTDIWEVLQHRALHRQLVEISIQKGADPLRQRGSFVAHDGGQPEAPVCGGRVN